MAEAGLSAIRRLMMFYNPDGFLHICRWASLSGNMNALVASYRITEGLRGREQSVAALVPDRNMPLAALEKPRPDARCSLSLLHDHPCHLVCQLMSTIAHGALSRDAIVFG